LPGTALDAIGFNQVLFAPTKWPKKTSLTEAT
jgi:hypothetical protein